MYSFFHHSFPVPHCCVWSSLLVPQRHYSNLCRLKLWQPSRPLQNLSQSLKEALIYLHLLFYCSLQEKLSAKEWGPEIFSFCLLRLCPVVQQWALQLRDLLLSPVNSECYQIHTEHQAEEAKLLSFSEDDDRGGRQPCSPPLLHQFGVVILKKRHIKPCSALDLLTNTSVVYSLLEDLPNVSQISFVFS